MSDLRAELENYTGEYPPTWTPEDGDIICGAILRYEQVMTRFQQNAWVVVIDDDECGPLTVWLTATVLVDQFKRLKPKIGEVVGVKCLGKEPDKGYWRYVVKVDREEAKEPDFDSLRAINTPQGDGHDPFDWEAEQ